MENTYIVVKVSRVKAMRRKKHDHQQKKFLIRKQVLLANIVGNVKRTEWRI